MKILRYATACEMPAAGGALTQVLCQVETPWSEAREAAARQEAWEGKYTVEDDGIQPQPTAQDDADAMLIDHEYRLTLLELGITE